MKKTWYLVLAGAFALTGCQGGQASEMSAVSEKSDRTSKVSQTAGISAETDIEEEPAITVETSSQEQTNTQPPLFRPIEAAQAELDSFFSEWEQRTDGTQIAEYSFSISEDSLLIHDGSRFVVYADFTVLPVQYDPLQWAVYYADPDPDGRITDGRFYTFERDGARFHIIDIVTGEFNGSYADNITGLDAGVYPVDGGFEMFCPAEIGELELNEYFEQAKQDDEHPIADFSFDIDGSSVVCGEDGAFSFFAAVRVLPSNTDNENIGYWTGANGVVLDNGWIESYRCYTLERENGVYDISGIGTGMICTPYLSDEWDEYWS